MTHKVTFRSIKDHLKIRIKIQGQPPGLFDTGIFCPADKFDAEKQISGYPQVQTYMQSTTEAIRKMFMPGANAESLWTDLVKQRSIANGSHKVSDAFEYYLRTADVAESTEKGMRSLKSKVESSGLYETPLKDLTGGKIREFLMALGLKESTVYETNVKLNNVLRRYISDQGLDLKVPKMVTKRPKASEEAEYLVWDELRELIAKEVEDPSDRYGKDLWCLMALTGMAVSDLLKFDPVKNISEDGKWVHYNRKKTESRCTIPLLPMAKEIIDRYKWPARISVRTIQYKSNGIISELVGRRMKSHSARKTFGTVALEWGYSIEAVSKFLGHANPLITANIYAKVSQAKIEREMQAIPDAVQKMMVSVFSNGKLTTSDPEEINLLNTHPRNKANMSK